MLRGVLGVLMTVLAPLVAHAAEPDPGAEAFKREIDVRLEVPAREQSDYAKRLDAALARAGIEDARPQYFLLIDRSPRVQAAFLYWRSPESAFRLVGATPAATGRPGEYEHFLTPLGVFAHSLANPDFRAEGTRNAAGILGYGAKGMRIYDFGWVEAERTWDPGRGSLMRLQVHSTDPDLLEPMLGAWHSKGCIRIPALLNLFIDRYGLLDAGPCPEYERIENAGAGRDDDEGGHHRRRRERARSRPADARTKRERAPRRQREGPRGRDRERGRPGAPKRAQHRDRRLVVADRARAGRGARLPEDARDHGARCHDAPGHRRAPFRLAQADREAPGEARH
jgi:hypothetical protein